MQRSIATYKANLSRLANEVLDAADELQIHQPLGGEGEDSPPSGSRSSRRRLSRVSTTSASPVAVANGVDHDHQDEIAKYKADILKLQASEAEIRSLSLNYASILKEKEEQLSKLREDNGSLRKSLEAQTQNSSSNDNHATSLKKLDVLKANSEKSSNRQQRHISQENSHSTVNHSPKFNTSKEGSISNWAITHEHDALSRSMELNVNSQGKGKENPDYQKNDRSLTVLKAAFEAEIKQLKTELEKEHENAVVLEQKLQEEHQLYEHSLRQLNDLKMDKERKKRKKKKRKGGQSVEEEERMTSSIEMKDLQNELNEKASELGRLDAEVKKSYIKQEPDESQADAKNIILTLEKENAKLEKENTKLKMEKSDLEQNLKLCMKNISERTVDSPEDTEKMALIIRKLEEALKDAHKEREKALQELSRLKQHLLEKELEDSEKMDEDSKLIDGLQVNCELQRAHIVQLEKALKQEIEKKEELKKLKNEELRKSNEAISDLKQKLANCTGIIDSKNIELLNLQTVLGQYYAESEAKERLGRDLAMAREKAAKLSESLKEGNQELEISKREKEMITAKLSQTERMLSEGKLFIQKLEEDNIKLRRALEHSMTTLNRMSLDSDNSVDRRIVIKLLVTYFQRNHSKEVLDLMVRMLGFTEEDKQRIGFAQHAAGKGVVRGVLGLPGRLVGGIIGGNSPETPSRAASDNQSFADLWVDFLLKETEEREKRGSSEASSRASSPQDGSTSLPSKQFQVSDHSESEFSTVPLTSVYPPAGRSSAARLPSKYGP